MGELGKYLNAMKFGSMQILTGSGSSSGSSFPYLCALALAKQLGVENVDFPGNYLGYAIHSKEFAVRLHEALKDERSKIEA